MGLDGLELGPGTFYMTTRDDELVMSGSTCEVACEVPFSADTELDYCFEFKTPLAQEFTADSLVVDYSLLNKIAGAPQGWHMEYEAEELVQCRHHRKKRINKKWAKRYGYKTVKRKVKLDCGQLTFERVDDGYDISFVTKGLRYQ